MLLERKSFQIDRTTFIVQKQTLFYRVWPI